jgi:hypothetical protein
MADTSLEKVQTKMVIGKLPANHLEMKQTKRLDSRSCYFYPLRVLNINALRSTLNA